MARVRASLRDARPWTDQRLGDVRADPHHRIERRHRLLEHEADSRAANLPHRLFGKRQQVLALEKDLAAGDAARFLHQADDRKRRDRLAAARFADEPQRFALADLERHVVDGHDRAEHRAQVLDLQKER